MKKKITLLSLILLAAIVLAGCTKVSSIQSENVTTYEGSTTPTATAETTEESTASGTTESGTTTTDVVTTDISSYTIVDISTITDSVYTISKSGSYALIGTNNNLQIYVSAKGQDVILALSGCTLSYQGAGATIFVEKAQSFTLEVVNGTSYVSDSTANTGNAVILVKSTDGIFEGTGTLDITANGLVANDSGKGIHCTKVMYIKSGTYTVQSANDHAFSGKLGIVISGGTINVNSCAADAIHSAGDSETANSGYITISNATLNLTSTGDGIDGASTVHLESSTVNIATNGSFILWTSASGVDSDEACYVKNGDTYKKTSTDGMGGGSSQSKYYLETSAKGIKSDALVEILSGTFVIDTDDDAIHSNTNVCVYGGNFTINTLDDGMHADGVLQIGGAEITANTASFIINILSCYEGLEGTGIQIYDGNIYVTSSDDGINAAGGADDTTTVTSSMYLQIKGDPYIVVNATGDGLDANGSITMTGGTVIVFGPSDSGNGGLDYDSNFYITGGTLIVVGSSGMAQVPDNLGIYCLSATWSTTALTSGTTVYVGNDDYSVTVKLPKAYTNGFNIVVASSSITKGSSYTIKYGGTASGSFKDNVAFNATYSGGSTLTTLTVSSYITTYGNTGIGGTGSGGTIGGGQGQPGSGPGEGGRP